MLAVKLLLAFACLALPLADAERAQAFELFGVCFSGNCEDQNEDGIAIIDPRRYTVELVVDGANAQELEEAVSTASALWLGKDRAVAGSAGLVSRARGDYRRILAALYNAGHYNGSISITLNGREAADIAPGAEITDDTSVRIAVDTGDLYRFGTVDILNQAPVDVDYDDVVPLPSQEGLAPGEPALAGRVRLAEQLSIRAWRQLGHPKAKVAQRTATAVHPEQQLNVTLRMDPGPHAVFSTVSVEGTEHMDAQFVAYMTGLKPGEEFDPDELERARERLDRLGVFALRRIDEAEEVSSNGLLPLNVLVQEKKLRRIGVGATFSSIDGAGIEAFWMHRNLFGEAERLRLEAEFGGIGASNSLSPDELDYKLGATFTKPGVFDPDVDLVFNVFGKREFNQTFEEVAVGASLDFNYYYSKQVTATAGVFTRFGKFDDAFGKREFFYSGFNGSILFDGRDDKLEPTKGVYTEFRARPYYEARFGNFASRFDLEGRTYYSFDKKGRTVLAARARAGSLIGASIEETPPDILFTTGGGGSVRGYGFNNIGLRQPNGDVTGGRSLLEGSLELRQRFGDVFGAVAFVDAGTVGESSFDAFSGDLKVGVGVGLRYYTGLGAIRLDVAVPLNPDSDDPSFAIYAGIGQAF
ncbi:MAG: autotransporter assembly complex protein TamA [Ahrensia sp.]|nr:autotransporter assembly complex protein TamA [Ahrensia sp.]